MPKIDRRQFMKTAIASGLVLGAGHSEHLISLSKSGKGGVAFAQPKPIAPPSGLRIVTKEGEFARYTDPDGCMALHPGSTTSPSTDNSMLFTAEKLVVIGATRQGEVEWFKNHVMSCITQDRGFIRHPNLRNPSSYDDVVGAFAFLKWNNFIAEARTLFQFFDIRGWQNHDNWLGRFPHMIAFGNMCANQDPGLFGTLALTFAFGTNKGEPSGETSGKCMLYLMSRLMMGHGHIYEGIVDDWRGHIMNMYGSDGMKAVYRIYFGSEHPMTTYGPVF